MQFASQGKNLVISALKKSELDGSIVLRVYEIEGAKAETPVTFLGQQESLREADLPEQELGSDNERILRVNPYEIRTLILRPDKLRRPRPPTLGSRNRDCKSV